MQLSPHGNFSGTDLHREPVRIAFHTHNGVVERGKNMKQLIKSMLGDIVPSSVLDVACGLGSSLELLSSSPEQQEHLVGIDLDFSNLRRAHTGLKTEKVNLVQMDAEHVGFVSECYDLVSIFASIHHLKEPEIVIKEMLRVLRAGGSIVIAEMYNDALIAPRQNAVQIHHWAAEVDTFRGLFHHKTFARQAITNMVDQLDLEQVVYKDYVDVQVDPFIPDVHTGVMNYINNRLDLVNADSVIHDTDQVKQLVQRGQALKDQIENEGVMSEAVLVVVGRKPA